MAGKRQSRQDEVMLIPFLDILCSLIGVLILIIVTVCVAQMQKVKGRTAEDMRTARKYQDLQRQQRELEKSAAGAKAKADAADRKRAEEEAALDLKQKDLAARQQKLVELKKKLALSAEAAGTNKREAAAIQKQVEDLLAQIEAIKKSVPPLQQEISLLRKDLAERQKKPEEKPPSVIVRPSGSGTKQNQRLYFAEVNGAGVVIHKSKAELLRVPQASVGQDKDYNAFLQSVKSVNGSLIFLVRKDGWGSYLKAAGWAEQAFSLNTGKLPIPGDGSVDLSLFEKR
jgi:uncharacterized protein YlxW (UPF0749 family)